MGRAAALGGWLRGATQLDPRDTVGEQEQGRMRELPGTVYIGKEEDAREETKRWRGRADTAWMDGSRLEDGVAGVAVVLWDEAHPPPLLGQQRAGGHTDQSGWKRAGGGDAFTWAATKRSSTPEVFAIYEAMRQLEMRGQWEEVCSLLRLNGSPPQSDVEPTRARLGLR